MLRTTPEHPFFVQGQGWTAAGELQPGDLVSTATGEWLSVESVTDTHQSVTVYNFRVSEYPTYFIAPSDLAFDVWVHNAYTPPAGTRLPSNLYGEFQGVRGNSAFRLNNETAELLGLSRGTVVNFRKGRVDFSPFSQRNLNVRGLTGDPALDKTLINEHVAKRLGLFKRNGTPNGEAALRYLRANNLTPHHAGRMRVQLVDSDLHDLIRHTGSAYDLRNGLLP